ncbi:MAG: hypothetical protein ACYC5G_02105 [Candidatus Doudnabacteria bacterium]
MTTIFNERNEIKTIGDHLISAQYPLCTDGDSVYEKDLVKSLNNIGTFTGDILSLFNSLDTSIIDNSSTNPKYIEFYLERPIRSGSISLVARTGNFSNVKIIYKDRQNTIIETIDDSANNTKFTSHKFDLIEVTNVCCIRIEFHTVDIVTLSFVYLRKILSVRAYISGTRDDKTRGDVSISNSNKLKVVTQEFGYALSQGDITDKVGGTAKGERAAIAVVTTGADIWGGTTNTIPIPPDSGDLISVVSTSIEDTNITGTGIWSIDIFYIDPIDGLEKEISVTMNGTTPVDTGILARYVNKMYSSAADGGALGAVGTITAYKTGAPTTVYRQINPGGNTDLGCDFMVPGNRIMYLTQWKCSVAGAGKPVAMRLRATMSERSGDITPRLFHTFDTEYLETSTGVENLNFL